MLTRNRMLWAMVLLLLLGAGLRFGVMTVHGLDGDDGFSLRVAEEYPTGDFIRYFAWAQEIDQHPKLYFLALDVWIQLVGTSLVALRGLNMLADMLLGAVLMQTLARLINRRAALVVGLLWAVNPLLIWVDGLVRMYGFLTVLAGLSWLFLLRALLTPRRRWWVAFALVALGAAYSQILGVLVLASSGVLLLVWAARRRQVTGLLVLGGVGVLYLPYMVQMWGRRAPRTLLAQNPPSDPFQFVQQFLAGLAANRPPLDGPWLWLLTVLVIVLGAGAWVAGRRHVSARYALLLFGVSTVGFAYFMLDAGIFQTKFFALLTPLLLVIMAAGVVSLPRRALQAGALGGLAIFSLTGLFYQLQPSAWEDFPAAASYIETYGDDGDLIIVMSNYGGPPFSYHYTGKADVIAPWFGVSADMPLDDLFTYVIQGYDTVWLVFYQPEVFDPEGLLDGWFRDRYPLRAEVYPNRVTVRAFDLRAETPDLPPEATPYEAVFGEAVALRGYELDADTLSRQDAHLHPPSGWLHATLYWESLADGASFTPVVTLEDTYGQVYGGVLAHDPDVFALHPSESWPAGTIWRSDVDLNLNPDMPPGTYKLVVRVQQGGAQLPVGETGNPWAIVQTVEITP